MFKKIFIIPAVLATALALFVAAFLLSEPAKTISKQSIESVFEQARSAPSIWYVIELPDPARERVELICGVSGDSSCELVEKNATLSIELVEERATYPIDTDLSHQIVNELLTRPNEYTDINTVTLVCERRTEDANTSCKINDGDDWKSLRVE